MEAEAGKLFELGFLCAAGEFFGSSPLVEAVQKKKGRTLLSLKGDREFFERLFALGRSSFKAYWEFVKCSTASQFKSLKPEGIDEAVVERLESLEVEEPLNWLNADFTAYCTADGKKLALILEITTLASTEALRLIYSGRAEEALERAVRRGIRPAVNYLDRELGAFAREVGSVLASASPEAYGVSEWEAVKFAQAVGYAVSHALEKPVPYYFVGVVSPLYELPSGLFRLSEREGLREALEELRFYYSRKRALGSVFVSAEEKLKKALEERVYEKELGSIEEVREEVKRLVKESENGNLYFYLHPAGAGKTTQIINLAAEEAGKKRVLLLYFAPRKKVVEEKAQAFVRELSSRGIEAAVYTVKRRYSTRRYYGGYGSVEKPVGNLKEISDAFLTDCLTGNLKRAVGIFATTQSVSRTEFGKTASHLRFIVENFVEVAEGEGIEPLILLAVDEITGSEGGLPALADLAEVLKDWAGLSRLFALDANLLCGRTVKDYLSWAFQFLNRGIPAPEFLQSLTEEEFASSLSLPLGTLFGFNAYAYGKPAFPAKALKTRGRVIALSSQKSSSRKEELAQKLVQMLLEEGGRVFLYLQDKETLELIAFLLKGSLETALVNARKVEGSLETADVILATSSASRGIDVPVDKAVVVIPSFSPEVQLGELYQAVSRIRRGKEDSRRVKEVVFVYAGPLKTESDVYRAARTVELARRIVLSYALKEGELERRAVALPPVREHRGEEGSSLYLLFEVEDVSGVPIYSTAVFTFYVPSSPPDAVCYPFGYYFSVPATVSVLNRAVVKEALRKLEEKKKEKGVRADRIEALIEFASAFLKGDCRLTVPVAVHLPLSWTFSDELRGKEVKASAVNALIGEKAGIGGRVVIGDGVLAFPLRVKRSSCYGGVPRLPIEVLGWV